jgi:hypothetical protein
MQRRAQLHKKICKCGVDIECVTRNVDRMKRLQARLTQGRNRILHLDDHCHQFVAKKEVGVANRLRANSGSSILTVCAAVAALVAVAVAL